MNIEQVFLVEFVGKSGGRKICICTPIDLKRRVVLKGKYPKTSGVAIRAEGYFTDDKKTFVCDNWIYEKIPKEDVFIAYAKTFKDIGQSKAYQIYLKYGADYSVFQDPDIMQQFSKKHYQAIVDKAIRDSQLIIDSQLMETLSSFGVIRPNKITKICKAVTMSDFIKDPFVLMTVPGARVSFKTCNSIVLQMQEKHPELLKHDNRILHGVEYSLKTLLSRGHTYVSAQKLLNYSVQSLNDGVVNKNNYIDDSFVKKQMNIMHQTHRIKAEKNDNELRIYDAFYYDCENFIAKELYRKITTPKRKVSSERIVELLDQFDKTSKFALADSQRLAIETVVNNEVCIITGSAGTGKTTVLKAAIYALEKLGKEKIVLAAPTGRAARRMAESTGHDASTLHSLLHLGIESEDVDAVDVYMDEEKLDAEAVFVDEASMCDIGIIYRLFQKLPLDCKVYFIGDPNQLESVGSGNVLSDMINSYCVPVVKLKFIYRQAKDSNIIMNADRILNGKYNLTTGDDFEILNISDPEKIAEKIADIYKKELDELNDIFAVQCICPARREGIIASNQLNKIVQKKVNPISCTNAVCFKANGFKFFVNDKVICSKNTKTVRNGDIGVVTGVTPTQLKCLFDTGEEIFTVDEAIDLGFALAYCISVHKSQGSEFLTTIMPISEENSNMLKRNLFYTAVTRARTKMILVGDKEQISKAIFNNKTVTRNGLLKQRIQKEFNCK